MQIKHAVMAGLAFLAASAAAYAAPGGGTISGKVTYEGAPPKMKPIDMSVEPSCAKMYATPPLAETVVAGIGNSLENVVVYVSAGAPAITEKYEQAEFIPVKCNVHPWMHGTLAVMPNSHYAVTGAGGSFSLPNLPPGKYTVTAWHESFGAQSQDVTIAGTETHTINFVFKANPN